MRFSQGISFFLGRKFCCFGLPSSEILPEMLPNGLSSMHLSQSESLGSYQSCQPKSMPKQFQFWRLVSVEVLHSLLQASVLSQLELSVFHKRSYNLCSVQVDEESGLAGFVQ